MKRLNNTYKISWWWLSQQKVKHVGQIAAENYDICSKPHSTGFEAISIWTSTSQPLKMKGQNKTKQANR